MKTRIRGSFAFSLLCAALYGCSLNTDLSIPQQALPASFPEQPGETSIAAIDWRNYFADADLLALIDSAIAGNQDLRMALQRIETARSSVKLANAAMLPKVSLNLGGGVQKFGLYTMDGAGNASTEITPGRMVPENLTDIYLGLQSSWEIDVWGKLENQRKAATANYLSSIDTSHWVIANLVADVAIYYTELLALDQQLDVVRLTIGKQQEALDIVRLQKETGRANELAVRQFHAQLLDSEALEKSLSQQIAERENNLNFLLGRYPQPITRSKTAFFGELPKQVQAGIPSQLLANRPDVRAAEQQIEASKFDLQAAKAAFYPNFNITAALGFQAFNPEFLFTSPASLAYSLMGTLVAPIINMKSLEAQFNTAQANQLSAMYNYQKAILNAYVEVANQLSNIKKLNEAGELKRQQSEVLKQSVEAANELYKAARASYLEVLVAQQSALQSNLQLIDVVKQQRLASIGIYKALGGGWK